MRRLATTALIACALASGVRPAAAAGDPLLVRQWGIAKVGAAKAWPTATGAGVVIAVVDSGVDLSHADLKAKLVTGRNYVEPGQPPQDDCGHGTHVAGIAAASTGNAKGIAGVAPKAKIMPVRVLASDGSGGCSGGDAADAIRWAVDHGARVINLSLGEDTQAVFGASFSDAIRYAWSKGAISVVAAGNSFVLSSGFGDEPAIVVAATDRNDGKPLYSSGVGSARWGMSAPGGAGYVVGPSDASVDILSTYADPSQPDNHDAYAALAGTSMAAPFVSGAAALLLSMGLTKEQVVDRLLSTADHVGSSGTFGHGRLNVDRAVHAQGSGSRPTRAPGPPANGSTPTAGPVTRAGTPTPSATRSEEVRSSSDGSPPSSNEQRGTATASLAAPTSSPREDDRMPLLPIATGAVGLAVAAVGTWALYRVQQRRR